MQKTITCQPAVRSIGWSKWIKWIKAVGPKLAYSCRQSYERGEAQQSSRAARYRLYY